MRGFDLCGTDASGLRRGSHIKTGLRPGLHITFVLERQVGLHDGSHADPRLTAHGPDGWHPLTGLENAIVDHAPHQAFHLLVEDSCRWLLRTWTFMAAPAAGWVWCANLIWSNFHISVSVMQTEPWLDFIPSLGRVRPKEL